MIGLLLWACASPPAAPGGVVEGESWTHSAVGVQTDFPPAWQVNADPTSFTSGLDGVLAEAQSRDEGLRLAVAYTPLPFGLDQLAALDLLGAMFPSSDASQDETYLLERVPGCHDGIYRRRTGVDGRTVHQLARRAAAGLIVWHAWQGSDRRGAGIRLRQIACERTRVNGA